MGFCCFQGDFLDGDDDAPPYLRGCLDSLRLAGLALLLACSITLQILACAIYSNWWPMLTFIMYVLLPMPFLFVSGSASSDILSEPASEWADVARFLVGFSITGSFAIPSILYHAKLIQAASLGLTFASFLTLMATILLFSSVVNID